jgi:hypothetical protein
MTLISEVLFAVNLITDNIASMLSADIGNGSELSFVKGSSGWV